MYEECKGPLRHAWYQYNPLKNEISPRVMDCLFKLFVRCERCSSTRHDGFDGSGNLITRDYQRPDGYSTSRDEQKPTYNELRLFVVKRRRGVKKDD